MNYNEAIDFLFSQLPMYQRIGKAAYKANLDNTLALDAHFGHPHHFFRTLHVAGTNGKGSVSHLLASILMEAGFRVGLYTSPHLKDFRERIRVNGQMIGEEEITEFVVKNKEVINSIQPSFFEMTVALAFNHFKAQQVDIAVIEVGLGGRLDSTNIITPCLSVITNIGLDHMALLGETKQQIATEKAGIIKQGIPVVIGEMLEETAPVFQRIANNNQSIMLQASDEYTIPYSTQTSDFLQVFQVYKNDKLVYPDLKTPLLGIYQRKNSATVITAVDELIKNGFSINRDHLYNGFANVVKNTSLMGRWQILGTNPLTICDTGHNEDGIKHVVEQISQTPHKQLHMVIGMVNDKDVRNVLQLLPQNAIYYFTRAAIPRSLDADELRIQAQKIGLSGLSYPTVADAVKNAKKNAGVNDLIFIGGSTFIVAEVV
jgi:dihydrofolate synthase/folylpolyglutamate synthase